MCMCYMVQKQMETLTVATMKLIHTRTSLEFLHACKMVELYTILNNYADLRFDGVEINLQKQKD